MICVVCILVGLLTDHSMLDQHLVTMHTDPARGEEEESLLHFLEKCCATMIMRYCTVGHTPCSL